MPVWLQILQVISLIAIACVGARIAWRQYLTAAAKFRLDLFDRRMKIYVEVQNLLSFIMTHAKVDDSVIRAYTIGVSDAEFLFDQEFATYLERVRLDAIGLRRFSSELEEAEGDSRRLLAQRETDYLIKLAEYLDGINDHFRPYMQIEQSCRLGFPTKRFTAEQKRTQSRKQNRVISVGERKG